MINELYAVIGEDGIWGFMEGNEWIPMVFSHKKMIKKVIPIADEIKEATGKNYGIYRFELDRKIDII